MEKYPSLSLCMIAKDEAHIIREALESVSPLFDEFILVDTGSTDATIEIAKEFGVTVIEEPWEDDFSKHRNTSLEAATKEWILVIDADEMIDSSQHELLKKLTLRENHCYLLPQRHYSNDQRLSSFLPCRGEYPKWERDYVGYFESSLCRLFPNDSRIRYRNRVHELVEPAISEHEDLILVQSPIRLHHYGHTPEARARKNKTTLYTPLGEKKLSEQPDTWKAFYELGVEHNCNGRPKESVEAFQRAAELNPEYVPMWVNYGYVLIELARFEEAERALSEALAREPANPEAHCNLAVMHMRQQRFEEAIPPLQSAIEAKPDYINAYSNLGTCLMKLGRISEASKVFEEGYRRSPNNSQLLLRFGYALLEIGILDEAKVVLGQVVKLAPKDPIGWELFGKALEGLKMPVEANLAYDKVRELQKNQGI